MKAKQRPTTRRHPRPALAVALALSGLLILPLPAQDDPDEEEPDPGTIHTSYTGDGEALPNTQPSLAVQYFIARAGTDPRDGGATPFVGEIKGYAGSGNFNGDGWWLPCQGQLLSIGPNQDLFAVLGTRYGGDGRITFALPDLRGRVPVGASINTNDNFTKVGEETGDETVALARRHLPQHSHSAAQNVTMEPMNRSDEPHTNMQPSMGLSYLIRVDGFSDTLGELRLFAGNFAPNGWMLCDGSLLSIADHVQLFSAIGNVWGGDGRTTFALPDLRDRACIGAGSAPGLTVRQVGERAGTNEHTISMSQMPRHNHEIEGEPTGYAGTGTSTPYSNIQQIAGVTYAIAETGIGGGGMDGLPGLAEICAFAKSSLPGGWRVANGATVNISDNEDLFDAIGSAFGGNGTTNFKLPDLRGRLAVAAGNGPGLTNRNRGQTWGNESKTLEPEHLPRHRHEITIDTEEPLPVISSEEPDPTNASAFDVTITFTEDVYGFSQLSIVTSPGTISQFTEELTFREWSFRFQPDADGPATFNLPAGVCNDEAGNANLAAEEFAITVDTTGPQPALTGPAGPLNSSSFQVSIDFGETVAGFTTGDLQVTNGSVTGSLVNQGSGLYLATITADQDGTVSTQVRSGAVSDNIGNTSSASAIHSTTIDTTAPGASLSGPGPDTATLLTITLQFSELVTGFQASDLVITNGAITGNMSATGYNHIELEILADGPGTVTVQLPAGSASDLAGNPNSASNLLSLTVLEPSPYEAWASTMGLTVGVNDDPSDDPDADGKSNLEEFAYDCDPLDAHEESKVYASLESDGGSTYLTLTLPARDGIRFANTSTNQPHGAIDGVEYFIRATYGLQDFTEAPVRERTPIDTSHLPVLSAGYSYHSFRLYRSVDQEARAFIQGMVISSN